ncbi:hypothetical protein H2O64_21915 [Kordia sp. YSTF-M3]|uniref:Uncharacterized protein n=1 Tax=Kordia aestuariivivens TaxID=2759037 RepID=A0ABR7QG46_9FLAO|nr:hypothetical protein [Kordia aestuariivivens]MBC8757341.1 hypothetical protein [Kordia aestuariivivens]
MKPWRKFRKIDAVLAFSAKNTSGKSALSFVEACAELDSVFFVRAKQKRIKV